MKTEESAPWLIGKVRVRLPDGTVEEWMTQMHDKTPGPYWSSWLPVPEGAEIIDVMPMVRDISSFKEVRIDQRKVVDALQEHSRS